jgi:hypothetical protein
MDLMKCLTTLWSAISQQLAIQQLTASNCRTIVVATRMLKVGTPRIERERRRSTLGSRQKPIVKRKGKLDKSGFKL